MKVDLALLADDAIKGDHNKLYILGEFRVVWTRSLPARHPTMAIVARLQASNDEVSDGEPVPLELEIGSAEADEPPSRTPKMQLVFKAVGPAMPDVLEAVAIVKINGYVVRTFGLHRIVLLVNGEECGTIEFHVLSSEDQSDGAN